MSRTDENSVIKMVDLANDAGADAVGAMICDLETGLCQPVGAGEADAVNAAAAGSSLDDVSLTSSRSAESTASTSDR